MKDKPLFAFFGTPEVSIFALNALEAHGIIPALVITAPDKPRGRKLELSPSPVKAWALERGIEVATPETLKDEEFAAELANTDWDLFIVAAYGKLIPKNILAIPHKGSLNVHPSLLPKFRGPSPYISNILANERETGVSIMLMDEKMDEGPIVAQARIEIAPEDWPPEGSVLGEMLFTEGGNLLAETLPDWMAGAIVPEPQDHSKATYTKKFDDADALVDISGDAERALRMIRAFDQNPRAHLFAETAAGKKMRVIITDAHLENGVLMIDSVIPEGKREMSYKDFLNSGAKLLS